MKNIKEIIIKLLRDYYDTDLIIRDIVVSRDKGKETINIFQVVFMAETSTVKIN